MNKPEEIPDIHTVFDIIGPYVPYKSDELVGELYTHEAQAAHTELIEILQADGYSERQAKLLTILGISVTRGYKWSLEQDRLIEEGDFETQI